MQLKANFFSLVERFASGKQELYLLTAPERKEKLYINAFLELFESGYAPHIGDVERLAGKKVRKLYVTLPHNYSSEWLDYFFSKEETEHTIGIFGVWIINK